MSEILARVFRNGRVESLHRGHISVVDADGRLLAAAGDADLTTYIRSAAKPFQIMPLLSDGLREVFRFTSREIAVMISSHNGEEMHLEAVAAILKKIDLTPEHLQCGFHLPLHPPAAREVTAKGLPPSPLYNNCSGKHAAMLAQCRHHDWPLDTYLDPTHPVQERIRSTVEAFSGLSAEEVGIGVDGCNALVFYLPLKNMARMFARLAAGENLVAQEVFDIMVAHPEMIAGTGRFDTDLMRACGGKVASKVGAEGIRCVAIRGDRPMGVGLKIDDGGRRAAPPVMLEVLRQLDVVSDETLAGLPEYHYPLVKNHVGFRVGHIEAQVHLRWS